MKTCKKGLHQYPDDKTYCSECRKAAQKAWAKTPKGKAKRAAADKKFAQSPKGRARTKKENQSPKRKAYIKNYHQTPKSKAYEAKRRQSPEYKAKQKAWRESPEGRAWRKEYEQKPERKASSLVRDGKRTKIAARGDFTDEQWIERLEEFDHKCAYCSTQLLTAIDGALQWHPQFQNLEHIVPLLGGGQHTKTNIIPACYSCNTSKNNQNVWKWMSSRSITPNENLLPILLEAMRLHQETINSAA